MSNNMKDQSEQEPILHRNLELWMTKLPTSLKSLPIIHLAIPGSHDSMTYTIQRNDRVGPDESAIIQFLGRYFGIIAKPIIFNWSVTQYDTVIEQLNGGIRYLDFRLAGKSGTSDIYFVHGLYGAEVSKPLQEISDWLSNHPNEVVILDFQHFYAFSKTHHQNLVSKIRRVFRNKLCPAYGKLDHITLQWLNAERYQVFVIYRNLIVRNETLLWPSGLWPTPWPNTVNTNQLIEFLDNTLKARSPDVGFVSQCLLTPDTSYVIKHTCGNLYRNLGMHCQSVTIPWINEHQPGPGGLNIVITDYVSNNNFAFSKAVIQRNVTFLHSRSKSIEWQINY